MEKTKKQHVFSGIARSFIYYKVFILFLKHTAPAIALLLFFWLEFFILGWKTETSVNDSAPLAGLGGPVVQEVNGFHYNVANL